MNPAGISSTWWVTSTCAGRPAVRGDARQAGDEVLAGPEVQAGGGLVEKQQLGVGHQGAGDLHPLALPLRQRAEEPLGERVGAHQLQDVASPRAVSGSS